MHEIGYFSGTILGIKLINKRSYTKLDISQVSGTTLGTKLFFFQDDYFLVQCSLYIPVEEVIIAAMSNFIEINRQPLVMHRCINILKSGIRDVPPVSDKPLSMYRRSRIFQYRRSRVLVCMSRRYPGSRRYTGYRVLVAPLVALFKCFDFSDI